MTPIAPAWLTTPCRQLDSCQATARARAAGTSEALRLARRRGAESESRSATAAAIEAGKAARLGLSPSVVRGAAPGIDESLPAEDARRIGEAVGRRDGRHRHAVVAGDAPDRSRRRSTAWVTGADGRAVAAGAAGAAEGACRATPGPPTGMTRRCAGEDARRIRRGRWPQRWPPPSRRSAGRCPSTLSAGSDDVDPSPRHSWRPRPPAFGLRSAGAGRRRCGSGRGCRFSSTRRSTETPLRTEIADSVSPGRTTIGSAARRNDARREPAP